MNLFFTLVLCGFVVLGFFLLVDGLIYIIANTGDRGESRRLRRLAIRRAAEQANEYRASQILAIDEKPKRKLSVNDYIDELIERSGQTMKRERVFIAMAIVALVAFLAMFLFGRGLPIVLQAVFSIVAGVALPIFHLRGKAAKRLALFEDQFPDTLDLIVRSLRIGHPLATSLQTIAREMPAPTGAEFATVSRQVTYGKTPAEAIDLLAGRMPSADLRFFAVAVQIHHEAGGNLGDILQGLSKIIRSRFQLFRKVKALTAEGRFSAWFLSGFPLAMIVAMNTLQPGYYNKVADYVFFPHLAALTFVLLIVNVFAMRLITKLEM